MGLLKVRGLVMSCVWVMNCVVIVMNCVMIFGMRVVVMIFVYEFWYVGGGCGLMMCWCGWRL